MRALAGRTGDERSRGRGRRRRRSLRPRQRPFGFARRRDSFQVAHGLLVALLPTLRVGVPFLSQPICNKTAGAG
ncbi:MAG TPA: hypothetical protein DIC50_03035 [Verrucomicrobia subdivision 3 bacterium]|nr:hypothetical protein [Limisphaerales bacterium]